MTFRPALRGLIAATVLLAGVAVAGPAAAAGPTETVAYVDVAVATLWVEPGQDRPVDAPSVGDPVDPRAWTAGMTLAERRWLVGKLETQASYGQAVIVTERSGDWSHVVVPGQPTPRDERGYPGWLPSTQLTTAPAPPNGPFAQVTTPTSWLSADPEGEEPTVELGFGTRLPVLDVTDTAVRVATPGDGPRWLPAAEVTVHDSPTDFPPPTGEDLVADAELFLGLPYLWAGVSAFGFDCSGLTHSLYRAYGVTIPRDADAQLAAGTPVDLEDLRPGDLLFYGIGRIHHVGMYIGAGNMIDARTNTDTTEQTVEIVPVAEHPYADEFAGAVSYLA